MQQVNQETAVKPQLRLVGLTPRAKRMLDAIVRHGEAFNGFSTKEKLIKVGVYDRSELCRIRQELEQAGYISTERAGNRVHVHLNPDKALPIDLPEFRKEALLERCIEIDNLDAHGERTDRYSPFQIRRREQIPVWIEVWNFFFPHDAPPSEANIRHALTLCGDSLEDFFRKMVSIALDTGEIAFRNHKKTHIRDPRAYVLKSLERHAREMGREVKPHRVWVKKQ